jgi:hypothetical protein
MEWLANATPRRLYPGRETQFPFYRKLCEPPSPRVGLDRFVKPRCPPKFDPQTIQSYQVVIPTELSQARTDRNEIYS